MRAKLLLLLVGLTLAISGFFVLYERTNDSSPEQAALPEKLAPERPRPRLPESLGTLAEQADGLPEAAALSVDGRTEVQPEVRPNWAGEEACELAGRVLLPAGVPADERLFVDVELKGDLAETEYSVQVDDDGAFAFYLPQGVASVQLNLDGRYLFLDQPYETLPDGAIALAPRLGAWLSGQITAPKGASDLDLSTVEVATTVDFGAGVNVAQARRGQEFGHRANADDDGHFELKAVHAGLGFSLAVDAKVLPLAHVDGLELAPGEHRVLAVPLDLGVTLAGRVVDDAGQGVAGASLSAGSGAMLDLQAQRSQRQTKSGPYGEFRLEGLVAGNLKLTAAADEFLQDKPLELTTVAGDVRTDLEVVLEHGAEVRGQVVDAAGAPVSGAEVVLSFDPAALTGLNAANAGRGASGSATSGSKGEFRIRGLGMGPFQLEATHEGEGGSWSFGRLSGVRPGDLELVLAVHALAPFTGRVVDAADEPLTEFRLELNPRSLGGLMAGNQRSQDFSDPDGRFQIEHVKDGKWNLYVSSKGYGRAGPITVDRPGPGDSEVLVRMSRGVVARGTVQDPDGHPVGGASVQWKADAGDLILNAIGAAPAITATSDDQGQFELSDLPAGSLTLTATSGAWADAEAMNLEASPDQVFEELVFHLRRGGSISGEVFDGEGGHEVGALIQIQQPGGANQTITRTDASGAFFAERLEAGKWQVIAIARDTDVTGNPADMLKHLKMDMVDVVDGEDVHVVLGAAPEDPVHVSGEVQPAADAAGGMAILIPEGDNLLGAMRMASIDEAGHFELDLEGPGKYVVTIQRTPEGGLGQDNVEFQEEIPSQPQVHLVFELPRGSISGRVTDPTGRPLGAVRVSLYADGGTSTGTISGGKYAETTTKPDGSYRVEHLRAGTYTVGAGGQPIIAIFDESGEFGRKVRAGLEVTEGKQLSGIDFELSAAGAIVGHVRSSTGQPVAGASLFVHDGAGILLERISLATTSSDGSFSYPGIAAGHYTISARSKTEASPAAVAVEVRSGEERAVELGLSAGTIVLISVLDDEGEPLSASLRVIDSEGRDVAGQFGMADLTEMLSGEFSTTTQRFGPLPPGKYEVFGDSGALSAKKPLTLAGQPERRIKLRLK